MPQDGSNNYQYPPGTPGIPDTTIESEAYNTFLDDLVLNDLNIPRPLHRGGTGASTADAALVNLKAEKAEQVVTAYLSQLWLPGSFRSAIGATDAPVAGHAFAGICYINEPLVSPPTNANVTVEARDMTDAKLYVRQKTAGVWGAWLEQAGGSADLDAAYVNTAGDTMTGSLILPGDPVIALHAATKQYVDARALDQAAYSGMQINGSMEVDQPNGGAVVAIPATSPVNYPTIDCWRVFKTGSSAFTVQQVASTIPGYVKSLKLTVTTAQAVIGSDDVELFNTIEGFRSSRLAFGTTAAKPVTVGFWLKSSLVGDIQLSVVNDTGSAGASAVVNVPTAGVAQWVVASFSGFTTGTWKNDNNIGIRVILRLAVNGFMNIVGTVGNTFEITGLVVLPGSQAPTAAQSPLIMRPYGEELRLCRRYYGKYDYLSSGFTIGYTAPVASSNVFGFHKFETAMRAVPTITASSTGANASAPTYYPFIDGCRIDITSGAAGVFYQSYTTFIADARL